MWKNMMFRFIFVAWHLVKTARLAFSVSLPQWTESDMFLFCSLYRQQSLFHVLSAYSVYNTVRNHSDPRWKSWLHNSWVSLFLSTGSELLPGHESDCCHSVNVHERGGCILGSVTTVNQSETCYAWWASFCYNAIIYSIMYVSVHHKISIV